MFLDNLRAKIRRKVVDPSPAQRSAQQLATIADIAAKAGAATRAGGAAEFQPKVLMPSLAEEWRLFRIENNLANKTYLGMVETPTNGLLHVLFLENGPHPKGNPPTSNAVFAAPRLLHYYSSNQGETWSKNTVALTSVARARIYFQGASVAAGPDGQVYLSFVRQTKSSCPAGWSMLQIPGGGDWGSSIVGNMVGVHLRVIHEMEDGSLTQPLSVTLGVVTTNTLRIVGHPLLSAEEAVLGGVAYDANVRKTHVWIGGGYHFNERLTALPFLWWKLGEFDTLDEVEFYFTNGAQYRTGEDSDPQVYADNQYQFGNVFAPMVAEPYLPLKPVRIGSNEYGTGPGPARGVGWFEFPSNELCRMQTGTDGLTWSLGVTVVAADSTDDSLVDLYPGEGNKLEIPVNMTASASFSYTGWTLIPPYPYVACFPQTYNWRLDIVGSPHAPYFQIPETVAPGYIQKVEALITFQTTGAFYQYEQCGLDSQALITATGRVMPSIAENLEPGTHYYWLQGLSITLKTLHAQNVTLAIQNGQYNFPDPYVRTSTQTPPSTPAGASATATLHKLIVYYDQKRYVQRDGEVGIGPPYVASGYGGGLKTQVLGNGGVLYRFEGWLNWSIYPNIYYTFYQIGDVRYNGAVVERKNYPFSDDIADVWLQGQVSGTAIGVMYNTLDESTYEIILRAGAVGGPQSVWHDTSENFIGSARLFPLPDNDVGLFLLTYEGAPNYPAVYKLGRLSGGFTFNEFVRPGADGSPFLVNEFSGQLYVVSFGEDARRLFLSPQGQLREIVDLSDSPLYIVQPIVPADVFLDIGGENTPQTPLRVSRSVLYGVLRRIRFPYTGFDELYLLRGTNIGGVGGTRGSYPM